MSDSSENTELNICNCSFCPTNSPKNPNVFQLAVADDKETQNIFIFKMMQPVDLNNYKTSGSKSFNLKIPNATQNEAGIVSNSRN